MIEREKFDRIKKEEIFLCVPVRNTQNLPRCALSWSWRYFWTRKINFICFHFWSTNFVFFFGTRGIKKVQTPFTKDKLFCFFQLFALNITRFYFFFCFAFHVNFYVRLFSMFFFISSGFLTSKNTPPTSLNTRVTIKSFTKCLHQIFTVYGR